MFRRLKPEKVYITEDVKEDPRAAARVERLMSAIDGTSLEEVSYRELNEISQDRWSLYRGHAWRWGAEPNPKDPDLVFTMGKFWPKQRMESFKKEYPHLAFRDLYGFTTVSWRLDGEKEFRERTKGIICHSAWQLHTIEGCPMRCAYCWFGGANRVLVNIEEYMDHLDEICERPPQQRLYKWDNRSDVSCFEPEYGASELLVDYFSKKAGKYLEIYVGKTDNVEHLISLDHKGKTILQWSVSPKTQSIALEPETASWKERIEAAKVCQEAGYIIRYRFSPMIPVKGWEEEYEELVDLIFRQTEPDVISLCPFGWMDWDVTRSCLDLSKLDPQYVAAMEAEAPFLRKRGFTAGGGHPIPHDARAYLLKKVIDAIRSRHPTIPIALCLETLEMWSLFQRELGMPMDPERKSSYFCNCGPLCTPEHPFSQGVTPGASWF